MISIIFGRQVIYTILSETLDKDRTVRFYH